MQCTAAVNLFLTYKHAEQLSARTLHFYQCECGRFIDYVADCDLASVTPIQIATYLSLESERGLSPSSCAAAWRALNAWLNWCVDQDLLERSPIGTRDKKRVRKPRVGKPMIRHVTQEECRRLLAAIPNDNNDWLDNRDRALVLVLFWSGLRLSECADLRVEDVDLDRRLIAVHAGKGNQGRLVPCAPRLGPALLQYLTSRPTWHGQELWLSSNGFGGLRGALSGEGIRQMLRRRCRQAGMRLIHPHAMRHGFAMAVLNAGADMSAVSAMLGHSSEEVTEAVYAHWLTDGLQREYEEALRALGQNV